MKKNLLIVGLITLVLMIIINYLIIKPKSVEFLKIQLNEKFVGYIAYKNNQRGFYLYLVDELSKEKQLALDTLYEKEAFNKPNVGDYIKHVIFTDSLLYNASHLGDKIEKLPNSNKCFLFTKIGIFRFNCYVMSKDDRKELGEVDGWAADEIGLWKKL